VGSTEEMTADWQAARLLPTVGLKGQEEQEQRATSSLLAVMHAVPEFAKALLVELGAPRAKVQTFTELQLKDGNGKRCIPDGALIAERGSRQWRCLVEVKTGTARLKADQVSRYLEWARDAGFDAVLTISNEITATPKDSPIVVDGRKLRSVALFHLSWWRILTEAIVQHRHRGLSDPDQAWLLGELIAYLDHERSGASGFLGMGENWVSVRSAAANETLRAADPTTRDVAEHWEQFVDYLALGLGQDLGEHVNPIRSRKLNLGARLDETTKRLAEASRLEAAVRVPNAVGDLRVEADLRTRRVTTSVDFDAPRDGRRPKTQVAWLVRQMEHAPPDLRIDASFVNARETASALLEELREEPERLLSTADPRRELRSFRVALARRMGAKRGREEGSFVRETRRQAIDFYRDIVQNLRAWQPPAPKLPPERQEEPTPLLAQPDPPAFSAVDQRDVGEAPDAGSNGAGVGLARPPGAEHFRMPPTSNHQEKETR
jgi:hypothetical protein